MYFDCPSSQSPEPLSTLKTRLMKNLIFLITLIGFFNNANSQNTLIWSEDFELGLDFFFYQPPTLTMNADTIKVVGTKNTPNGQRLVLLKYDLNGDTISSTIFGNDSVYNNRIIDYKFDSNNHVYVANNEQIGPLSFKIVIQKYNLDGNLNWVKQIENNADTSYFAHSLAIANDTCLFLTANKTYSGSNLPYLYALNSNGLQLWEREFNQATEISSFVNEIFVHNNTAFIFSGSERLAKVDINNNLVMNTNTGLQHGVSNVQLSLDSNLIVTSWVKYRISKADLDGNLLWTMDYPTNLPSNVGGDEIKYTLQDSLGNIYITGRHYGPDVWTPNTTGADILTIKYDSSGNFIWENRYESENNNADIGNFIALNSGNVYVGGQSQRLGAGTDFDYVVLKTNESNGNLTGEYRYNGLSNGDDIVSSLHVFNNDSIVLTGLSFINSHYDLTTQLLSDVVLTVPETNDKSSFQLYPNPITREKILTINGTGFRNYSIFSSIGQEMQSGFLEENQINEIRLNKLQSGVYYIRLNSGIQTFTRKLIID